jgi:hypothetical protein
VLADCSHFSILFPSFVYPIARRCRGCTPQPCFAPLGAWPTPVPRTGQIQQLDCPSTPASRTLPRTGQIQQKDCPSTPASRTLPRTGQIQQKDTASRTLVLCSWFHYVAFHGLRNTPPDQKSIGRK